MFKTNNVNYFTIGMILLKIILFQKLLLAAAIYCIISLHGHLKTKTHNRDNVESEESARFDFYNICGGGGIYD